MDHVKPEKFVQAIRADPAERLLASPKPAARAERAQLIVLFALFLGFHVGVLGLILSQSGFEEPLEPEKEIAVEVVPPPEPPPPPDTPPEEQKTEKEQQKQPPPPSLDLKPAFDAPRAPNEETADRDAPDKETSAPTVAPPPPQAASAAQSTPSDAPKAAPAPTAGPQAERAALDKPDAEPIEQAEPKPDTPQPTASPNAAAQPSAGMPLFMQQLSNLKPIPDYKLSGAAKPAPVSGGTEKTNYLSILYGLITPHLKVPPTLHGKAQGSIVIYIDTVGHVLHMGVVDPSGSVDLDNAALAAVRLAAPFPTPPPGLPPVRFTYGTQRHSSR